MAEVDVAGKVVVVTGAGRELGLGRTYALELARRGAAVVVNDIDGPSADHVVGEIVEAGGRAVASVASVATEAGGEEIIGAAVDAFGTVDVLIHNAGAWRNAPFEEMTTEKIDPVIDVHLKGAFFVGRPAWKIMREKGYGRIVLTSSPVGAFGRLNGSNYVSVKAGLLGLCRAMSLEGAADGIFTNCVLPTARTIADADRDAIGRTTTLTSATRTLIEGRGEPERVAALVTYLSSSACEVSGEAFSIRGGCYARVFFGVTPGWLGDGDDIPTAEDIAEHWDEIESREDGYLVPVSAADYAESIVAELRG